MENGKDKHKAHYYEQIWKIQRGKIKVFTSKLSRDYEKMISSENKCYNTEEIIHFGVVQTKS